MSLVPLPVKCLVNNKFEGLANYTEDLGGESQSVIICEICERWRQRPDNSEAEVCLIKMVS